MIRDGPGPVPGGATEIAQLFREAGFTAVFLWWWEMFGMSCGKYMGNVWGNIMIYIYIWDICEIEDMGETFRGKKREKPWGVLRGEAGGFLLWWPPRPVAAGAPYAMISPPDPLFQMLQEGLDRRVSDILAAIVFIESRSSARLASVFFPAFLESSSWGHDASLHFHSIHSGTKAIFLCPSISMENPKVPAMGTAPAGNWVGSIRWEANPC